MNSMKVSDTHQGSDAHTRHFSQIQTSYDTVLNAWLLHTLLLNSNILIQCNTVDEKILHHLESTKRVKYWDKLPTSTGAAAGIPSNSSLPYVMIVHPSKAPSLASEPLTTSAARPCPILTLSFIFFFRDGFVGWPFLPFLILGRNFYIYCCPFLGVICHSSPWPSSVLQ